MNFIGDTLGRLLILCIAVCVAVAVLIPVAMLRAWVLIDLWNLFGTSAFHMAAPPFWSVMGLLVAFDVARGYRGNPDYKSTDDSKTKIRLTTDPSLLTTVVSHAAWALVAWGVGHLYFWLGS